jgi:hypothetical protein
MTLIQFGAAAATWQNFYLLIGTSAATLVGLMFVAVTFGAGLVSKQSTDSARAFLDPPFTHFVTVLVTACLMLVPTMSPMLIGCALMVVAGLRTLALIGVQRRMREAHRQFNDIELSDWILGVVLPAVCYLGLTAAGVAFLSRWPVAFSALAVAIVVVLLLGIFGAWELMLWLALSRVNAKDASTPEGRVG